MSEAREIAELNQLYTELLAGEAQLIERALDARSIQQPRDLFWAIPDDAPDGPYLPIMFTVWDAPHLPRGLFLLSTTAATAVVTIEVSLDGGTTWLDTMLAGPDGAPSPATMSSAIYGGAHKSFLDTPPITGAGAFSVTRFDPGAILRVNFTRGGASGLKVQLACHVARALIRQPAPLRPSEVGFGLGGFGDGGYGV